MLWMPTKSSTFRYAQDQVARIHLKKSNVYARQRESSDATDGLSFLSTLFIQVATSFAYFDDALPKQTFKIEGSILDWLVLNFWIHAGAGSYSG
jgi:hypothetical protein